MSTRLVLDSGDPEEFREISKLAKDNNTELWGATTNPTLIAKKAVERLEGKKISKEEAFELQKQLTLEILEIVPGAVSAEVYADHETSAEEMVEQGKEIATWDDRVVVKLPTTLEGLKAREQLRKNNIVINNTLVFSQQQIFAICRHEHILQRFENVSEGKWPCFISPFVGRLDDVGEAGMDLVRNGMRVKQTIDTTLWMLEASIRNTTHIKEGLSVETELMTAPAKVYRDWFAKKHEAQTGVELKTIPYWDPPKALHNLTTLDEFYKSITSDQLNIDHPLTKKGIARFADDWKAILK